MPNTRAALKLWQIAFAVLFCLLTAGVIFGFAAIKPVLIGEGIYDRYCDSEKDKHTSHRTGRPCLNQDLQLNLAFTISVVITNVGALPVGVFLDKFGPQITSVVGAILFALGNIALGLDANTTKFDIFLTGYILLAIGGPMIFLSSFHLCNAFPKRSGLILSSIIGAFDASSLPFVIYGMIYRRHRIHLRQWFWAYALIPAVIVVEQICLAPRKPYSGTDKSDADETTPLLVDNDDPDRLSARARPSLSHNNSAFESSFSRVYFSAETATKAESEDRDAITGILWGQPALKQICTLWFWLPQLFLLCFMLRINYEIATVSDQVFFYTKDADLAQTVTDAFVVLLPLGGVLSIPMIGYILDKLSSMAAFVALMILGTTYGVLCMTGNPTLQIIGIVAFTIMRPLMYTAVSDYYTKVIGVQTFGTVYGFANAMSGAFTMVQYPIDYAVKRKLNGNYTVVNLIFVTAGALLAIATIAQQYYGAWRPRKARQEQGVED